MIVVAGPRCGGTIFCLDKQKETGLPFVGEMHYRYFSFNPPYHRNWKRVHHETGHQETLTIERCVEVIENPDKFITLINGDDIPGYINKADYILLRKNILDVVKSSVKFCTKVIPNLSTFENKRTVFKMLHNYAYTLEWCDYKNVTPLWYEDLYLPPQNNYSDEMIADSVAILESYFSINPRIKYLLEKHAK